ncbi:MAG: translation initiation factor IF-2 subunit gamma [Methanomassiliicoccales archaeon]|nr:translation initiation factor IF-2 subunit gamma [Methanomassiliicoccales archaeon]NYT14864.1 translation initiation factor IF-2 subunit gamma [Methanomassiliicoccales archaeon]
MKVPKQPEINIGMIGHVDHGKTTLTKALSGEWTDRHSEEVRRGISIRLGYADAAFYKCSGCQEPQAYGTDSKCKQCGGKAEYLRAVSFVDAPGHETLMATMLSGAAMMQGALLMIAANEPCPQPQTKEHLMALSISGVEKIIVVQNKVDIVTREEAIENYNQIKEFVKGTIAENAPIIPVSAHHDVNIDKLIQTIEEYIPTPKYDEKKPLRMYAARSFDINTPGSSPKDLKGGVLGGTLTQGKVSVGDEIEIKPGRKVDVGGKPAWEDITTTVESLHGGGKSIKKATPGGLVAIGTKLDPSLTKSDGLTGRLIGKPGTLPEVLHKFVMKTNLLERVVGTTHDIPVENIKTNEPLMLSIGTATTVGVVTSARSDISEVVLKIPVCAAEGQRVAISRKILGKWRLIGYGIIE